MLRKSISILILIFFFFCTSFVEGKIIEWIDGKDFLADDFFPQEHTGNTMETTIINTNKVTYTADSSSISRNYWTQWNIDLKPTASKRGDLYIKSFTFGIEDGTSGVFYVDDIRLYRDAPLPTDKIIQLDK